MLGFFSLVGVLTIEQKMRKRDFQKSPPGILATLFPTVPYLHEEYLAKMSRD
jgi:hypothetical protein